MIKSSISVENKEKLISRDWSKLQACLTFFLRLYLNPDFTCPVKNSDNWPRTPSPTMQLKILLRLWQIGTSMPESWAYTTDLGKDMQTLRHGKFLRQWWNSSPFLSCQHRVLLLFPYLVIDCLSHYAIDKNPPQNKILLCNIDDLIYYCYDTLCLYRRMWWRFGATRNVSSWIVLQIPPTPDRMQLYWRSARRSKKGQRKTVELILRQLSLAIFHLTR